jgi:hypothetical protein
MTGHIYLRLLALALVCASPVLASTTRCADAALYRAGAPADLSVGGPPSITRELSVEPAPYVRDERLTIIAVELPDVVVAGMHGAYHRARCVLLEESKRAAPLQPGGVLIVRSMNPGLAVVERVTAGRPDGCWYVLLEFRLNPIAD